MKSGIWKTTFREIGQRKGQYIAIMLIVALGVGMFSGLKSTGPAMRRMEQTYMDEHKFHDVTILSTLGLTEEDVDAFEAQEGVKAAEGCVTADGIFALPDGEERILKAFTLSEKVDEPVLMAGRLPSSADECVVDSKIFEEEQIGQTLTLLDDNFDKEDEDNEDLKPPFSCSEYKIVGTVQSPRYIQAERGSTELGGGKLDGFMYVTDDGLTSEVFTQIDIRFEGEHELYSDAYDDFIEGKKDTWKAFAKERAALRRADLIEEEIDKAYKEHIAEAEAEAVQTVMEEVDKEIAEAEAEVKEKMQAQIRAKIKALAMQGIYVTAKDLGYDENAEIHISYEDAGINIEKLKSDAKLTARKELKKEITKEVKDEMPEAEVFLLYRDSNVGYVTFENDSAIVNSIADVFPVFFFLVAALICMTTIGRMVEEQRTQIGVMKALGYTGGKIMIKFLFYSGTAAITGAFVGYFAGIYVFPTIIWYAYGIYYRIADVPYLFNPILLGISVLVAIICSVGVTLVTCSQALRETAAELMRPRAPKAGKRIFLEYLPFIWNRMKFIKKVSARNLFRYKKRFFMMVLGIGGCTALLVTGFGIKDSIADVANEQFDRIQLYDMRVAYKDALSEKDEEKERDYFENRIEGMLAVLQETVDLENEENDSERFSVNLVVPRLDEAFSDYFDLHTKNGEPIDYPKFKEAVIADNAADYIGADVGDDILIWIDDTTEISVHITGICKNYLDNFIFISEDTYEDVCDRKPEFDSLFVNVKEGEDHHKLSADWMKRDGVSVVYLNGDTRERFASMMKSLNIVVFAVIICAAMLAFVVLYNLTSIQITERIREIATIKVLGFYERETAAYVQRENFVLTLFGSLLGLYLGKLLHAFVMHEINIRIVSFDNRITWISYGISVLMTLIFTLSVNAMMRHRINEVSMTESLKSVE